MPRQRVNQSRKPDRTCKTCGETKPRGNFNRSMCYWTPKRAPIATLDDYFAGNHEPKEHGYFVYDTLCTACRNAKRRADNHARGAKPRLQVEITLPGKRTCRACAASKPATSEHFGVRKNRGGEHILTYTCRPCIAAASAARRGPTNDELDDARDAAKEAWEAGEDAPVGLTRCRGCDYYAWPATVEDGLCRYCRGGRTPRVKLVLPKRWDEAAWGPFPPQSRTVQRRIESGDLVVGARLR